MSAEWLVRVGGALGTTIEKVQISSIKWGYAFPRECTLFFPGQHDIGISELTNNNEIWISTDDFTTLVFRGWLELNNPQGVKQEGISYKVLGSEGIVNHYTTKFNGSIDYVYNIDNLPDYNSPNSLGGNWTVGQIMVDVLEHAIGLPSGGSAIPLHHPSGFKVTNAYLPSSVLNSYSAADLLALDLPLAEIRITAMQLWDVLQMSIQSMDHHGLFIDPTDPNNPTLIMHDYSTSTLVDLKCGIFNTHIGTESASAALVIDSNLQFNIAPSRTKIIIEGRGKVLELNPFVENGTMVPHWSNSGGQAGREWIIWDPQTYAPFWEGTLSNGLWGPILIVDGVVCNQEFTNWDLNTGVATTDVDLRGHTVEVWTLYLSPFQVIAGPGGDAYDNYGLIHELSFYDDNLLHTSHPICVRYNLISTYTPWVLPCTYSANTQETAGEEYCAPQPPRDDTGMMQAIADIILARLGDERIDCTVQLDGINLTNFTLRRYGNFSGLAKWNLIDAQVMEITVFPPSDMLTVRLTNDVFRVPGYSEWKRRFMLSYEARSMSRTVDRLLHEVQTGGRSVARR